MSNSVINIIILHKRILICLIWAYSLFIYQLLWCTSITGHSTSDRLCHFIMNTFQTIVTQCTLRDSVTAIRFKQYVGNSTIGQIPSLSPGDVLINIESKTVSYVGLNNRLVPWTSLDSSKATHHPLTSQPHILVPLQLRYSWLPLEGYLHWNRQALLSNPMDDLSIYIDRMKLAAISSLEKGVSTILDGNMNSNQNIYYGIMVYLLYPRQFSQYFI